jgi:hypothetical protein
MIVAWITFVACSDPMNTPTSSATLSVATDTAPRPLDPDASDAAIDAAPFDTRASLPDAMNLRRLRHGVTPRSFVGPNDHEDAGIGFQGAGRYTSLFAIHELHPHLQLPYLPSQSGSEWLYAPTTKDGCLEHVTVYVNHGFGTEVQFAVFDWCNAITFIAGVTVNDRFVDNYVRDLGFGTPAYVTEIYTHDRVPRPGTKWYSLIFNFHTRRWNAVTTIAQQPLAPDYNGWSIFETYFLPGPCPRLPSIRATAISLYDTEARTWRLLTPRRRDITSSAWFGPPSPCWVPDDGGATYRTHIIPDHAWEVLSER